MSIVHAENINSIQCSHIELDSHDVIIAEGALSKSFVDDNRPLHVPQTPMNVSNPPSAAAAVGLAPMLCGDVARTATEVEAVQAAR